MHSHQKTAGHAKSAGNLIAFFVVWLNFFLHIMMKTSHCLSRFCSGVSKLVFMTEIGPKLGQIATLEHLSGASST